MNTIHTHDTKPLKIEATGIELYNGDAALALLSDESFVKSWDVLYDACAWATVFQSRTFVTTWYNSYQKIYTPIIVIGKSGGELTGLLHMAQRKSGTIIGAGDALAEYQVWLTNSDTSNFIELGLKRIYDIYKGCKIQLKYIPETTPIEWINKNNFFKTHCFLKAYKQPLLQLDTVHLDKELKKKNRKEKLNRLKRMGELEFRHVTDDAEFCSIIDELTYQFDFRKGAMFNTFFFLNDPTRKAFLLELFRLGIIHVSILKLNGVIIASNASIFGKGWVHLQGINTHAPYYAKYSPGILHLLMLGQHLANENYDVFDLTPGENAYKNILATHYITSHKIIIDKHYKKLFNTYKNYIASLLKKRLSQHNVSSVKIKNAFLFYFDKFKNKALQTINPTNNKIQSNFLLNNNYQLFVLQKGSNNLSQVYNKIKKDNLHDLLLYKPHNMRMTRWVFLKDAMRRFEMRQNCFTLCEDGILLFCVWFRNEYDKNEIKNLKISQDLLNSPMLDGFYYHPSSTKLLKNYLSAVSSIAVQGNNESDIYVVARTYDKLIIYLLKSIGYNKFN